MQLGARRPYSPAVSAPQGRFGRGRRPCGGWLPGRTCAASGLNDIEIELADDGDGLALRLRQVETAQDGAQLDTPERRILQVLAEARAPVSQREIRERAATRPKTVAEALSKPVRENRVERASEGEYRLAAAGPESVAATDDVKGGSPGRPLPKTVTAMNR